jgi:hypothetical protein
METMRELESRELTFVGAGGNVIETSSGGVNTFTCSSGYLTWNGGPLGQSLPENQSSIGYQVTSSYFSCLDNNPGAGANLGSFSENIEGEVIYGGERLLTCLHVLILRPKIVSSRSTASARCGAVDSVNTAWFSCFDLSISMGYDSVGWSS